jgi:hypothetical protein
MGPKSRWNTRLVFLGAAPSADPRLQDSHYLATFPWISVQWLKKLCNSSSVVDRTMWNPTGCAMSALPRMKRGWILRESYRRHRRWNGVSRRAACGLGVIALCGCVGFRTPIDDGATRDPATSRPGCSQGTIQFVRASPMAMFVIDRSGSMTMPIDGPIAGETRWEALTAALASVLSPVDESLAVGAMIFPAASSRDSSGCPVASKADLVPATGNVGALIELMTSSRPNGSTPTEVAIQTAAELLLRRRAAGLARALVLATDGAPNCNSSLDPHVCRCAAPAGTISCSKSWQCLDDMRTAKTIASYEQQGLPTYVLGIETQEDTQFTDVLNAMAMAGGRAFVGREKNYYVATSHADLVSAIKAILDQVGACVYLTTSAPDPTISMKLRIDGTELRPDQWIWSDQRNGEVLLLGDACQAATGHSVTAIAALTDCQDEYPILSSQTDADLQ